MVELKSQVWQEIGKSLSLYDPNAQAGVGVFVLPKNHWLTNAAKYHDGWYIAVEKGELLRTPANKAHADIVFFRTALADAYAACQVKEWWGWSHDWEKLAGMFSQLSVAWLAIRSPVGELAWRT